MKRNSIKDLDMILDSIIDQKEKNEELKKQITDIEFQLQYIIENDEMPKSKMIKMILDILQK